jgi:hypothetical protein
MVQRRSGTEVNFPIAVALLAGAVMLAMTVAPWHRGARRLSAGYGLDQARRGGRALSCHLYRVPPGVVTL